MSKRDYYEVLGVDRSASDKDIKNAYRRMAMKYHPDRNPGDKAAEESFKEINEAFEILSDSQKKATYDRYGHAGVDPNMGGGVVLPVGMLAIFSEMSLATFLALVLVVLVAAVPSSVVPISVISCNSSLKMPFGA